MGRLLHVEHTRNAVAHTLEYLSRVGQGELLVVGAAQFPGPCVEELNHLGARIDLVCQMADDRIGDLVHQLVDQVRLPISHAFDFLEVSGPATFHHVGTQGPGSS